MTFPLNPQVANCVQPGADSCLRIRYPKAPEKAVKKKLATRHVILSSLRKVLDSEARKDPAIYNKVLQNFTSEGWKEVCDPPNSPFVDVLQADIEYAWALLKRQDEPDVKELLIWFDTLAPVNILCESYPKGAVTNTDYFQWMRPKDNVSLMVITTEAHIKWPERAKFDRVFTETLDFEKRKSEEAARAKAAGKGPIHIEKPLDGRVVIDHETQLQATINRARQNERERVNFKVLETGFAFEGRVLKHEIPRQKYEDAAFDLPFMRAEALAFWASTEDLKRHKDETGDVTRDVLSTEEVEKVMADPDAVKVFEQAFNESIRDQFTVLENGLKGNVKGAPLGSFPANPMRFWELKQSIREARDEVASYMGLSKRRYIDLLNHCVNTLSLTESGHLKHICAALAVAEIYIEDLVYIPLSDFNSYVFNPLGPARAGLTAKFCEVISKSQKLCGMEDVTTPQTMASSSSGVTPDEERTVLATFLKQHLEGQKELVSSLKQSNNNADKKRPNKIWDIEERLATLSLTGLRREIKPNREMIDKLQLGIENHPLSKAGASLDEIRGKIFPYTNMRRDMYWSLLDWPRYSKNLVFGEDGKIEELIAKNKAITLENVGELVNDKKENLAKKVDMAPFEFFILSMRYWIGLAVVNIFPDEQILPLCFNYLFGISQEAIVKSNATTAVVLDDRMRQRWDRLSASGYDGNIVEEINDLYVNKELSETVRKQMDERWSLIRGLGLGGVQGKNAFYSDQIHSGNSLLNKLIEFCFFPYIPQV